MRLRRAVTLLELMVVTAIIAITVVAGTRVLAHSLRLSERAQMRSELTALAQAELEQARVMASMGVENLRIHDSDQDGVRLTLGSAPDPSTGLLQITVSAEALRSSYPLQVTLHGWVMPPEAQP